MKNDPIYILVLAWNHKEDTRETLTSFLKSDYPNYRIGVIDNASEDDTDVMVKNEFPNVDLIKSKTNRGVSGGYNLGIEYAMRQNAKYILIANNDISVDRQMISCLHMALKKNHAAGIAMPKIYHYYGNRSRIWCSGAYWRKFPPTIKMRDFNKIDHGQVESSSIDFAPSCVLLLTADLINSIGLFDTNYFFYFDDWDYSKRARENHFEILFVSDAIMWHKVSLSTQKSNKPAIWWEKMGWSAAMYYSKYQTKFQRQLFVSWFFIRELAKGKPSHGLSFLRGVRKYSNYIRESKNCI